MNRATRRSQTIVFSRLGTGGGAEGTLTDWAKAVLQNGHDCDVLIGKSTVWQRIRLGREIRRFVGRTAGQLAVGSLCRSLDLWVSPSVALGDFFFEARHRLTALRFVLDPRRFRARKILQRAETVLVGNVLTPRGLKELRVACKSASLVLHHNGSPTGFSEDWLRRASDRGGSRLGDQQTYFEVFSWVVFQSATHREAFDEMYPGTRQDTALVWPSADEPKVAGYAATSSPFHSGTFNLVAVGKFQAAKNQLQTLKAFLAISQKYPSTHLTLVGGSISDRGYLSECVDFITRNDLSNRVSLVGFRVDATRYLAHADLGVHLAVGDGVSRAVREAAFLKKPMIIASDPGNRSFLGPEAAVVVDPSNVDQVAEAFSVMVDSAERRNQVATAAYRAYSSKASWPLFASNVQTFFETVDSGAAVLRQAPSSANVRRG